ncbi:protein FAR1-RELATED SEQUENCE 7-like [Salvia divinorum]|uniref:Protein FAR1-RELATED SEQUENCE 7-like n=1 Tax=Salvia divinorum TaxID=28513 RepID=A0ABD1GGE1_SALDI
MVGKSNGHQENEEEYKMEPHMGLEFNTAEEAQEFYSMYAIQVGFKTRIGQLYRSRVDGSVISRRFVCAKEGFQTSLRTGCPAFIRVQKVDSGKWVVANIKKEHNHEIEASGEICPQIQRKSFPTPTSSTGGASRTGIRSHEDDSPSDVVADIKRLKKEEMAAVNGPSGELCTGLEFNSANDAYKFYYAYATSMGFRIRIGQLFRSKHDGSITSRRFVCSKEGRQHPSRVGCGAYMRIQRHEAGGWVVDRLQKEHNHALGIPLDPNRTMDVAPKWCTEDGSSVLENLDLVETDGGLSLVKRDRESRIDNDWEEACNYIEAGTASLERYKLAFEIMQEGRRNLCWQN